MVRSLLDTSAIGDKAPSRNAEGEADAAPSCLGNWPLQLHLVPPTAPWLQDADLLLVADCVPFALADFHTRFLRGRSVVIGCPKLDDGAAYVEKLIEILRLARPRSLTVVHMEVPCCTGLTRIAQMALQATAAQNPLRRRDRLDSGQGPSTGLPRPLTSAWCTAGTGNRSRLRELPAQTRGSSTSSGSAGRSGRAKLTNLGPGPPPSRIGYPRKSLSENRRWSPVRPEKRGTSQGSGIGSKSPRASFPDGQCRGARTLLGAARAG